MTFAEVVIAQRRKCAQTTREAMLTAARARFLSDSYENVGLRDIARDVGVDVALVSRYFGSKEELFREVLRGGHERKFDQDLRHEDLPGHLVSMIMDKGESGDREPVEKLLIILRSASSPIASEIVHDAFRGDVLEPLADLTGGPQASVRAALALAMVLGNTILCTIMSVEPLTDADEAVLRGRLRQLFETALAPV